MARAAHRKSFCDVLTFILDKSRDMINYIEKINCHGKGVLFKLKQMIYYLRRIAGKSHYIFTLYKKDVRRDKDKWGNILH